MYTYKEFRSLKIYKHIYANSIHTYTHPPFIGDVYIYVYIPHALINAHAHTHTHIYICLYSFDTHIHTYTPRTADVHTYQRSTCKYRIE